MTDREKSTQNGKDRIPDRSTPTLPRELPDDPSTGGSQAAQSPAGSTPEGLPQDQKPHQQERSKP